MIKREKTITQKCASQHLTLLLDGRQGITESEPSFWGGDWVTRFAACFDDPPVESTSEAADEIGRAVNQAINTLPDLERRIIVDYYILCFSRRAIAAKQNLDEKEVDTARARAERRLKGILAEFVEQKFGFAANDNRQCPLCLSPRRAEIDDALARDYPQKPWGVLRRSINERFGLNVKRVQTVMTHWRYHRVVQLETSG